MQQIVDNEQLKNVLEKSRRILVTCGVNYGLDQIGSAVALQHALTLSDKEVTLFVENFNASRWSQLPEVEEIQDSLEPPSLHLSISYPPHSVEKINYENKEGVFELFFTPYPETFSRDQVDFTYSGLNYDLVLTVGVKRIEDLGTLNGQYPQDLDSITLVNIDNQDDNTLFGKINLVDSAAETCAQPVYDVIKAMDTPLSGKAATLLLSGVMGRTGILHREVSSRLLRFGALLLDREANWEKAMELAQQTTPEQEPIPTPMEESVNADEDTQPITPLAHHIGEEIEESYPELEEEPPTLPKEEQTIR